MKQIIIAITLLLCMTTANSYAGLYSRDTEIRYRQETAETRSGGFFRSDNAFSSESEIAENRGGGLFRSSGIEGPGDRPTSGEGIGQEHEAPLGDGLLVLSVCSALLMVVKNVVKRFKK